MLKVQQLSQIYESGGQPLTVLSDINFTCSQGETISIVGPSGSGKTTLLSLCAGLDFPTQGDIIFEEKNYRDMSEDERCTLRNQAYGFVFQSFHLLPALTALENVMVPQVITGGTQNMNRAKELLEKVGLAERMKHTPNQLSGGEQQRVALARAFMNQPRILFADEPTGNLDEKTSQTIVDMLFELNSAYSTTLLMVTHDQNLAQKTKRAIQLKGGKIISDIENRHE